MQICVSFDSISIHLNTIYHVAKNKSATIENDNKKLSENCSIDCSKCEKNHAKCYFLAHLAEDHESLWYGAASVRPSGANFFL